MTTHPDVWDPDEVHRCFNCGGYFKPREAKLCPKCQWLVCPLCGKCYCHLTPEAKLAVDALYETYCKNCRFRKAKNS
jgi:hypothetical protein